MECTLASQKPRKDGYVVVHQRRAEKKLDYAHRVSYERSKGIIPEGMTLDHLCRVRNCINPEHLEVVTLSVNSKRASKTGSRTLSNVCKRGHDLSGANVRVRKSGRYSWRVCRECQAIFMSNYKLKALEK